MNFHLESTIGPKLGKDASIFLDDHWQINLLFTRFIWQQTISTKFMKGPMVLVKNIKEFPPSKKMWQKSHAMPVFFTL